MSKVNENFKYIQRATKKMSIIRNKSLFLLERKIEFPNGLCLDGDSGQNTQTPRDKNKRCYSLKSADSTHCALQ